jgi:O-antigen/teichoic acid export membrane protein
MSTGTGRVHSASMADSYSRLAATTVASSVCARPVKASRMSGLTPNPSVGAGGAADVGAAAILDPNLSSEEIKRRAATGVGLLAGRSVLFKVLGLLGNLVLARLLVPADFGIVALGLVMVGIGQFFADAGVGAALVNRRAPPSLAELGTVAGFQLIIASAVGLVGVGISLAVGGSGSLTALMMLALPLLALRGPILLVLQRQLAFGLRVKIELVEILLYLTISIFLAALGLGAISLVLATIARAAGGTAVAWAVSPSGPIFPRFDFARLRPILAFGLRMQASGLVQLGHDAALTAGIGAIAGLTVLGLWGFAWRILQVPYIVFESMWSVAFPAFSRLAQAGEDDLRNVLELTVTTVAIVVAALFTPIVASAPAAVPLLFGDVWSDVSLILPGAGLALVLAGPIGICAQGFLYAVGDATTVVRGSIALAVVRLSVTLVLLSPLGVAAIGLGWLAGTLVEMSVLARATHRRNGARIVRRTLPPSLAGIVGGSAGWVFAEHYGPTLASAAGAAVISFAVFAAVLLLVARQRVREAITISQRMLARVVPRG